MAVDLDKIREAAQRVATSHSLDVVDLEFAGSGKFRTLRVFLEMNAEGRSQLAAALDTARAARNANAASELDRADAPEDMSGVFEDGSIPSAVLDGTLSIEHLSGVTHEHCETFSRDFGMLLDVEDLIPGAEYLLEVSSPGLDRKLSREQDFRRFIGSMVKLQTFTAVSGTRNWKGRIRLVEGGKLVLDLSAAKPKRAPKGAKSKKKAEAGAPIVEVGLDFSNIEKANLVPEI